MTTNAELLPGLQTLPRGATALLLGGTDTGKTTWTRQAVADLTQLGLTVAVVDCDPGQGEIGPPGTVGVGLAAPGSEYRSLRDLTPLASYFVGAISPCGIHWTSAWEPCKWPALSKSAGRI